MSVKEIGSNAANKVWNQILSVRNNKRFKSKEIINELFDGFMELHGDRYYGDDKSLITGLAFFHDMPVTVIAQYKGDTPDDKARRQYGMPLPEGYRKSIRLMKQAGKFNRPIICIIDTPGAYPGKNAEERGQAEAIARNLYEMFRLKVPVLSIVIGEGGSGGALALGVANKIIMLENSIFSVVSPEGCASILWKDAKMAPKAAEYLKLTAQDLLALGVADEIIPEHDSFQRLCQNIDEAIKSSLYDLNKRSGEELIEMRHLKYRNIGKIRLLQK